MKTFDVFLKDRLTKMDVIIKNLTSNGVFSFYDKLFIRCAVKELEYLKVIRGNIKTTLDAEIERLYATVSAVANSEMFIDTNVDLSAKKMINGDVNLCIRTSNPETSRLIHYDFNNTNVLHTTPYELALSRCLNSDGFDTFISTSQIDTFAQKYITAENNLSILSNVELSGKSFTSARSVDLYVSTEPFKIYSSLFTDGSTELNFATSPILEVEYSRYFSNLNSSAFIRIDLGENGLSFIKHLSGDSQMDLSSFAKLTESQTINPNTSVQQLFCVASTEILRRRLLADMDDYSLEYFDDNSVSTIDNIIEV